MKQLYEFLCGIFLILFTLDAFANTPKISDTENESWNVTLKTTSIETILLNPEKILESPDEFWRTDGAYILSKMWHNNNRISLDEKNYYQKWLTFLRTQAEIPSEERITNKAFKLLEKIQNRFDLFQKKGISLLDDFLPKNKLKFKTTVHFTTKTYAYAFMTNTQIVSDILSDYFGMDPDKIMNSVTHECYHIGYGINRSLRKEIELDNDFIYNTMLDALQNEGLATYVGYLAQEFFPAKELLDYQLVDNPLGVKKHLTAVNELFSIAEYLPIDSLRKRSWEIGVAKRGYYVIGAYMARMIDQRLGRKTLLQTISEGPLFFVDTYNNLAEDRMKVTTFIRPSNLSLFHQLKLAAVNDDRKLFDSVSAEMTQIKETIPPKTQNQILHLGYGMIYQENYYWAVEVFKVGVALFPNSANSYDCLAEAYLKNGDNENAVRYYKRALEVDPNFKNAENMLLEIEKL